uniref:unspecific monooxygenase n=1 Tax=Cnaphalocrocis medinalis TaxID=437488 RepID=A0A0C5BXF5_CNAME|nr:cytochrome P450 monooxygenase CYP345A4 [Cnaphalocrocis medinalis]
MTMEYFSGSKKLLSFIINDWKLLLFLTLIFTIYFYFTSTFDYFEKRGIKYKKPIIFFGNLAARFASKRSFHDFQLDLYNYFKGHPVGGTFRGRTPILYIMDPDLIKAVTIRDFEHFVDRNTLNSKEPRYLSQSLLNLKGTEWKGVRSTLTPAFSSLQLRKMLPLVEMCTNQMVEFLRNYDKKDIEMKDIMGHYTLEVIGACAFGIKADALKDENSHFIQVAKKFNYMTTFKRIYIFFLLMFMPKMIIRYLNISFFNSESTEELVRVLQATKAERRSSGIKKNDFLQLLIDAAENEETEGHTKSKKILDDDTIDAQSLLFLIAGYETSSSLLSFAIHVLATKPDLQTKLREYVLEHTEGKEISYELFSQLHYLEGFLLETLRLFPPVAIVDRVCTKNYTLPEISLQLTKGDIIAVPVYGIHMDPDIYPEPEEFRPERFMDDEKKERPPHMYLPFGVGPRYCIGQRFAMFSTKVAMVALLKNFKFSVCDKTQHPVKFNKRTFLLQSEIIKSIIVEGSISKRIIA